jgi:4-amino-4-deoxy-L-arabinose transferase-like glycosyltransferase
MLARRALGRKERALSGIKGDGLSGQARIPLLLALWVVVIVVFFSFSSNKEDLYILPVFTAASALVGGFLSSYALDRRGLESFPARVTTVALGLIISLGGAAVVYLFDRASTGHQIGGASVIGYLALAGGIISAGLAFAGKGFAGLSGTGVTFLAVNWVFVIWALPDFERYKPVRQFCEVIKREASRDAMVGYYRFASPSMVFYLGRPVFEYYDEEELRAALTSDKEVYCIMTFEDYEAIRGSLQGGTNILASNPIFQVKLRFILERREPTQVVLVNNRVGAGSLQ